MRRIVKALSVGAAALSIVLAFSPSALADEPSADVIARAREEFRRGIALEAAGDFENALLTFKGVALVKSTPQVRFHIASCEEKVGEWVGALGSYRMALFEAQQNKVKDVEAESQAALARLEPQIPKLTIHRGAGAAVATIVLDGRELGAASIGAPISVNPGPHVVEATAPGRLKRIVETSLEAGKSAEVAVTLDAAPTARVEGGARGAAPETGPTVMLPIGIGIAGLGGASMIVSGVFFGMKESAKSDLDAVCGPDGQSCPESARGTAEDGALYDTVSMATFIGGVSALAIGGTLVVIDLATMGGGEDPKQVGGASPGVTCLQVGPTGFVLSGQF
jgi:hypothetical protein